MASDLSSFPTEVDLPSNLTAGEDTDGTDASEQMISFPFCLQFAGRAWVTIPAAAPSPELAASTMDQFVNQVLNPKLAQMGYPPNICSWRPGAC